MKDFLANIRAALTASTVVVIGLIMGWAAEASYAYLSVLAGLSAPAEDTRGCITVVVTVMTLGGAAFAFMHRES